MFLKAYRSSVRIVLALFVFSSLGYGVHPQGQSAQSGLPSAIELIYRQKYDDAITRLEEVLETGKKSAAEFVRILQAAL